MKNKSQQIIFLGFTAILIGYLTVWLPGPGAGLTLIGLEMNEWVKFLPQVQSGEVGPRHWLSLPPLTLAVMMAMLSLTWPINRWQTWALRGLAVLVSLLALPPVEVILDGQPEEWIFLVGMVGFVLGVVAAGLFWGKMPAFIQQYAPNFLIICIAIAGIILPSWVFWQIRPVFSFLLGIPVRVGLGVWLNILGHSLVVVGIVFGLGQK